MANYLLLFSGGGMPEGEAEQAAVMQAWGAWFGGLGANLVDGGNPFTPNVKTVSSDGNVREGPIGTMATGYSIIKADSAEAAAEAAKGCPVLKSGGQITVYETFQVM